MTNMKSSRTQVYFVLVLLLFAGFAGATIYSYAHSQPTSSAQITSGQTRVQNVSLSDYNAPAIQGTSQSNGTALYIHTRTEGNLGFQIVMPQAVASSSPQISAYVNGQLITGCEGLMSLREVGGAATENVGCMAPVTAIGSTNNVTILVYSPLVSTSGVYRYQSMIDTAQMS